MTNEEITRWAYHDVATKDRFRQALEREFGSFDHFGMTAEDLARYGLAKFNLPASDNPVTALDSYLRGRQQGNAERGGERVWRGNGIDRAEGGSFLDKYLNS